VRAVLDIGSNTVRLLVARVQDGRVERVLDQSEFVRLGRDVDRTGFLQPDREDAALRAIEKLATTARDRGANSIEAIATSAVREARNGKAFVERVRRETGLDVRIISGEREAYLTFLGATAGVSLEGGAIVADLGGGSTEVIAADENGVLWARSLALGSGRLTERYIRHDPPTGEDLAAVDAAVRDALAKLPHPTRQRQRLIHGTRAAREILVGTESGGSIRRAIFTGGTASALARLAGRDAFGPGEMQAVIDLVSSRPSAEIAADYGVQPQRATVLAAGIAALATIAAYYQAREITITHGGIREGALLAVAGEEPA